MDALNFPSYSFHIQDEGRKKVIFDIARKKFVALTPEEWVRQHVIHYLHQDKNWPVSLLAVETAIRFQGMLRRCDLIGYSGMTPKLLVECKAPGVKIDKEVVAQLARYQSVIQVPWLLISNGLLHLSLHLDDSGKLEMADELPDYSLLSVGT